MPIVDLTLDSSDEDTSVFEKHNTTPFSDNNVLSKALNGNSLQNTARNPPPNLPVSKVSSKAVARVTSKLSILDRLSRPIQFETPIVKNEIVKKEESDSDSDSDSQNFFANSSLFFPKVIQKSELPPSKTELELSNPVQQTAAAKITVAKRAAPVQRRRGRPKKDVDLPYVPEPVPLSIGSRAQRTCTTKPQASPIWPQFNLQNQDTVKTIVSPQSTVIPQPKSQQIVSQQGKSQQPVRQLTTRTRSSTTLPPQTISTRTRSGSNIVFPPFSNQISPTKPQPPPTTTQPLPTTTQPLPTTTQPLPTTTQPSRRTARKCTTATSTTPATQSQPTIQPPPTNTQPSRRTSRKRTTATPVTPATQSQPTTQPVEDTPLEKPKRQRRQTTTTTPQPPPVDSRLLPIESMIEVANMELKGNESRDVLEMVNCCRYLDYVIHNYRGMPLISLYKRFVKSKHYIAIEPEVVTESVIESPETTPVKPKATKQTKARMETVKNVFSEISAVYSVLTYPFKSTDYYLSAQPICAVENSRTDSLIHSICSCLHTEFDFRALNNYSLKNYCLKEKWICELLSSTTVDDLVIATHVNHYLSWMKQRFQLRLPFFRELIYEIIDTIGDIIEGNEVKRRGRKPKLSLREEEEKERKQKNYVVSSVSLLSLLSLLLLDELRNHDSVVEDPNQYQEPLKKCIFAVWDKTTRLANNPQMWLFAKKLMARVLNLFCSHQPDAFVRKDFLHFLVINVSNDTLTDLLFMSTEDQFKAELLGELSSSKKTRFSALMKNSTLALMAKQYGFKSQTKLAPSSLLILSLSEKIKNKTN